MYESIENFSEVVPLLLTLVCAFAGYAAGRLARRPKRRTVRRSARRILAALALAAVVALGEAAFVAGMWTHGWPFAANRVVVALPPVVAAAVAVAVMSVPRLARVVRGARREADAPPGHTLRAAAGDPRLVVPVQSAAVAALLCFYTVFALRPVPPYTGDVLAVDGAFAVAVVALWLRQVRRLRRDTPPRIAARLLRAVTVLGVVVLLLAGYVAQGLRASRLPAHYDMGTSTVVDDGMTGMRMAGEESVPHVSVADLTGDTAGTPDETFTLTARRARIRLGSGRTANVWAWNGQVPGPELVVHEGDLVQVTVRNHVPGIAVSAHWHGLDVPNAEDGVPGVTQNAVRKGGSFVYRFRVHQVGTFWYHSHQQAFDQVDRGLFGALVVLPKGERRPVGDITVVAHYWKALGGVVTLGRADTRTTRVVRPGTRVRLRLVNTSSENVDDTAPPEFGLTGTAFRVAAIDGTDLHEPGLLVSGTRVALGAGGRADLTFTMPDHAVRLTDLVGPRASLVLSPGGTDVPTPPVARGPLFDPTHYGTPAPTPFGADSRFDRRFTLTLDDGPGFYDGRFLFRPTIDGHVFPDTPMLMVRRGDLVEVTFVDRGHNDHPMHLHGHHALVLRHDGRPVTGSPWWTDTLDVRPGETYTVAFRADNPGIWMDHCHNLRHAKAGMIMHLGYEGVTTPYRAGSATGNQPE
ncbi:MAG TPA: multicopper oxidase family protein [Streptosporangiales bacterium]